MISFRFLGFVDREVAVGKWESCVWISTFPWRSWPGLRVMWKSRQRFPRARGRRWETCFWFSSPSSARHFRSPFSSSRHSPGGEGGKELSLRCLHLDRGADIAVGPRPSFQLVDGEICLQRSRYGGRLAQYFPRRGVPLVDADRLALAVFLQLRNSARPVKIQIRIEVLFVKNADATGMV